MSRQLAAATPLGSIVALAHSKSMMSPSHYHPMVKCAVGIRARIFLPSVWELSNRQPLLWCFSLACLRYLRAALPAEAYPIIFPFRVFYLLHVLKVSPGCLSSVSPFSFISISLKKSLTCLILSSCLLLTGSEPTEDIRIQEFMVPNCRK